LDRRDKHGPDWGKEPYETEKRKGKSDWVDVGVGTVAGAIEKEGQERMMELEMSSDSLF
jgi:hypothetical protein